MRMSDGERKTLAELGGRLGKQALKGVAHIVTPLYSSSGPRRNNFP
jgi:hypothetical protein